MMQEWYLKAKFGIFLHWGIYSVKGVSESWAFGSGSMSYDEYMSQLDGFTASKFNAEEWARIIKESGAKYAVLTAKHHDGVCLFDTKYTDLTTIKKTPSGRDLIKEYCKAMQDAGLRTGIYFTNTDWSDMEHMEVLLDKTKDEILSMHKQKTEYSKIWPAQTKAEKECDTANTVPQKLEKWNMFLERYNGQIRELLSNYGKIDLFWTDAMLYRKGYSWETKKTHKIITDLQPDIIINGRLDGYGDFLTSEQRLPLVPISKDIWEYVHTLNESWGYQPADKNFKSVKQVIRLFTEALSMGANMLLGIGPYENGLIPEEAVQRLLEIGKWIKKYEKAIYETGRGLAPYYFKGQSTMSADRKTIYLFLNDRPNEKIMINGIRNNINRIICLTNGRELKYSVTGGAPWANIPGCKWIDINDEDLDEICTVIKIELEGELDLWKVSEPGHYGAQDY